MATNNCEIYSAIRRPLDAFIQYFLDVKPYHTKLLEVLEIYNFYDEINVTIDENIDKNITFLNKPLCNPTGWGVNWDDQCGFDAISCCDLFDCIGGFGLIYNNSDLLVSTNVISTTTDGTITITGNHTYDMKLPIKAILNADQFTVAGDQRNYFNTFNVFLVIPRHVYNIHDVTTHGFTVTGDISSEVVARRSFLVYGSLGNDGTYEVITATYNTSTNLTNIVVNQNIRHVGGAGVIQINASNKNNGAYQVLGTPTFNGVDTIITTNGAAKKFTVLNETTHGSVQFRSGLIYPRHITLSGSSSRNDGDYRIIQSVYNNNNTTTITVSGLIPDISATGSINLYGYEFEAGFEGGLECSIPKPADIHMIFSERLVINIRPKGITPTPTPTSMPTPTPTPIIPSGFFIAPNYGTIEDVPLICYSEANLTNNIVPTTATVTHIAVYKPENATDIFCSPDGANCNITHWVDGVNNEDADCPSDYSAPWGSSSLRDSTTLPYDLSSPFLDTDTSYSFDPTIHFDIRQIPELNYNFELDRISGIHGPWTFILNITTDIGDGIFIYGTSDCI